MSDITARDDGTGVARVPEDGLVALRRDLHRYAEPGWAEFRTAAKAACVLRDAGFDVALGREVLVEDRPGLPAPEVLEAQMRRALAQGADPDVVRQFAGGYTGVVGTLRGRSGGPTVALRFEMDANAGLEASDVGHRPAREGFASVNPGAVHNCGHDAHTAMGLVLARRLGAAAAHIRGEVRLIFQPAEEGLRGGRAMTDAGVVDGADAFLGCHIGVQALTTGEVIAGYKRILASHKFDALFVGRNAHAGISPHEGRNALLAAVVAAQNLTSISRHGEGDTRINVGTLNAGEARNAVPAHATLCGEVRADSSAVLDYMVERVITVVEAAAAMHEVEVSLSRMGGARGADSDDELGAVVQAVAARLPAVTSITPAADFAASDDVSELMARVQQAGGRAVYFGLGSALADLHHTPTFDVDESALATGVDLFLGCLRELGTIDDA
jgi:aminobenzoyl-glutamate utilization protein A